MRALIATILIGWLGFEKKKKKKELDGLGRCWIEKVAGLGSCCVKMLRRCCCVVMMRCEMLR
jgi:hypothetical protein